MPSGADQSKAWPEDRAREAARSVEAEEDRQEVLSDGKGGWKQPLLHLPEYLQLT